jgi:thiol-disulfide isomerase/thioredoxin
MSALINYLRGAWKDPFKRYVAVGIAILAVVILVVGSPIGGTPEPEAPAQTEGTLEVHFFYHSGCPHCRDQEPFNEEMAAKYPDVYFVYHDGADPTQYDELLDLIQGTNISEEELDFPLTIVGKRAFVGWISREESGTPIEQAIISCLAGDCGGEQGTGEEIPQDIEVPLIGRLHIADYSLPVLAVVLGLVDGFNPCAMWVLAYLISILFVLQDRRKAWLLVGSFVLASGVLYYLFMTAWLNAFLLIGYSRPVTVIVGAIALGAGIFNLHDYIKSGGQVVCEVVDADSRKSTMSRIQTLVSSPLNAAAVLGIIALAFVVNSIEFVCSAALPAIFTQVLALADLSTVTYYLYILLYVLFFMLDDLIIFGAAAFAVNTSLGQRYAAWSKPIGGTILLILGVLLLFAPQLLR